MLNSKSKNLQERAFTFSSEIVIFVNTFPNKRGYWSIGDQLTRAGTSIGANLRESKGAPSSRDFINFFHISLKSANETLYWLEICTACFPEYKDEASILHEECSEIANMIGASLVTLKKKK